MSDKKNSPNAQLEANLAKIANTKPRKRMRKDNIYERFITRVENVDSNEDNPAFKENALKPLKNTNHLSSYEPLSATELELFANLEQESVSTGINIYFSDDDKDEGFSTNHAPIANTDNSLDSDANNDKSSLYIADSANADDLKRQDSERLAAEKVRNEQLSNNNDAVNDNAIAKQLAKSKEKQVSSKKPLIIGMIFGSLLIATIVATLIFTGVLSTSTKTTTTDAAPAVSTGKAVVTDDNQPSADTSAIDKSTVISQPDESPTENPDTNPNGIETTEAPLTMPAAEAAITYDDFREESQSTLYRETND
ncbi:hypothetical protein C8D84_10268 [Psychrobacter immobilis]|uniref:Uncharacterized protein n=1 Tax=Psychrobacter immobilis TaxID=498 RepID=A0A2V1ZYX6_PSYIM|nr:hypothetical protein [Psychrobacter immobilis]PWK14593.1 hypothetical protein C8D84_10268 [Psychrobacter immobilis]